MYAVIADRGKQYIVQPGERLRLDLRPEEPGATITFDRVLLLGGDEPRAGRPLVEGVTVTATVIGEVKGTKLIVFKKRRRKGYRRKQGHRQRYTDVLVGSIDGAGERRPAAARAKAE